MSTKRVILVTGATGAQGGSVARALLQNGQYAVRILTRHADSEKAKELQSLGAEVAVGDLSNKESLRAAIEGCYGVFGVTDFWEHFQKEYELGVNLIDTVAESEVQHFVLHTLADCNTLSSGRYPAAHCDMKAAMKRYTRQKGLPATFLEVAFYYENFFTLFQPKSDQFGTFQFGFPQGYTKLAMVSVEDVGAIVARIFAEPEAFIGRTVGAVGADRTCEEYAEVMTRVLGVPVHYNYIPRELYVSLNYTGARELANVFEVQRLFIRSHQKEMEESYRLNPDMQTFESWVAKHKARFLNQLRSTEVLNQSRPTEVADEVY